MSQTALGRKLAAQTAQTAQTAQATAAQPGATPLSRALGSPRGERVILPVLGEVWIQLAGSDKLTEITSAVHAKMRELQLDPVPLNGEDFGAERTKHILAWSVRCADNHAEPFGTIEQWGTVDADVMMAAGQAYMDVRARLDPLANPALTDDECREILYAIEKKNAQLLMSYGVAKLSLFLLTTAAQPLSSPTPKSSPGE